METSDTDNPNVYGTFHGEKKRVVSLFAGKGWETRKCTWVDFEIENEWSEMIIEGDEPECLIHGFVNDVDNNIGTIIENIDNVVSEWSFEIYDDQHNLVKELRNDT